MILNTTKYSLILYKSLNQHLFWTTQFKMSILATLPIVIIAVALYFLNEMIMLYVSVGIVGILLATTYAVLLFENSSISRASIKYPNKELKYQFNGKDFLVTVKTTDTKTEETIHYKDIKKVKKTKKYLFIYLSKTDLYVVDKSGFENIDDYYGILDLFKDRFLIWEVCNLHISFFLFMAYNVSVDK